jgi:hypothetical protein
MKKYLLLAIILVTTQIGFTQGVKKLKISQQKVGDGLYNFYATNPNIVPMQVKVYFTELDNMSASCELPYVSTIDQGKHFLFTIQRDFIDLPGAFNYKFTSRIGAYPVNHDQAARYLFPLSKGKSTQAISFDFTNKRIANKIIWGFTMSENDTIRASRNGIVCLITEKQQRDSMWYGQNTITLLHSDNTFGKYEMIANNSFLANLGDTIFAGDPLALVESISRQKIYSRFSVYFVNAALDSIDEYKIRNFHSFVNPLFANGKKRNIKLNGNDEFLIE